MAFHHKTLRGWVLALAAGAVVATSSCSRLPDGPVVADGGTDAFGTTYTWHKTYSNGHFKLSPVATLADGRRVPARIHDQRIGEEHGELWKRSQTEPWFFRSGPDEFDKTFHLVAALEYVTPNGQITCAGHSNQVFAVSQNAMDAEPTLTPVHERVKTCDPPSCETMNGFRENRGNFSPAKAPLGLGD